MPTSYTAKLRLAQPATGELFGTWGTTVNTGITALVEEAIAGRAAVAMTDADYTLTASNGATDEARNMVVRMTGTLTQARNVICPTAAKLYIFENATTGGFAVTLKTSAGSGVAVAAGASAMLRCDGTNVVEWIPVTGTGSLVKATSPTLVTPALGTPASGVMTNVTGTAAGLTAGVANGLKSATTTVVVSAATAPTAGQVLTASSDVAAAWATPGGGGGGTPGGADTQIQFNNAGAFDGNAAFTLNDATGQVTATVDMLINDVTVGRSGANSGLDNTVVGEEAMATAGNGYRNTAIGISTLTELTDGADNTACGAFALISVDTGANNTAVGSSAGFYNTADDNTYIGAGTGNKNTTGTRNTALGTRALFTSISVNGQTAVGYETLHFTTGANNTAVGSQAGASLISGTGNTLLGAEAGPALGAGTNNVVIGYQAGTSISGVSNNVVVGYQAGKNISSGANNVCVGDIAGTDAVQNITTTSNKIVVGNDSHANAYIKIAWTVTSDARDKTNFAPVPLGLDFVCALQPTAYQYRVSRADATPTGRVRYGFRAQDILALEGVAPVVVDNDDPENLKFTESNLIPVLVKAIQELKAEFDAYRLVHP